MKLSYVLTLNDYKAARRLHAKQIYGTQVNYLLYFGALPIVALGLVSGIHMALVQKERVWFETLVLIAAGLACVMVFYPVYNAIDLRRSFNQLFLPNRTEKTSHLEVTDDCIRSVIPGFGEGRILWSGVHAYAQDDRITLIYVAPKRFIFFPTCALSPYERTELNDIAKRNVSGRVSC